MKYLDLLTRVREAGQKAEAMKRELMNACESGKSGSSDTASLKKRYMRFESEYRTLHNQAMEMIRASSDVELMRAFFLRRVNRVPWEDIGRKILSNRSEMELRQVAYLYVKANCDRMEAYSDCL